MGAIGEYVLSVTAAAMICSAILRMLLGKGTAAVLGKILTGIFMTLTILSPLTDIRINDFAALHFDYSSQANTAVAEGEAKARAALMDSISERTCTYILNKAKQLGVTLQVQVTVSDDAIPVPTKVMLKGSISPYNKRKLQSIIENDLGIHKENQVWT